ncbi:MAG: hypothetical protein KBF26_03045 [Opitutaceae bacterium]|nr:hypothetical protein [Opitutaceae bacterium]
MAAAQSPALFAPFWSADPKASATDSYVAFRAEFELTTAATVELQLFGAMWFVGWLDGRYFCEGPARFPKPFPEYQELREALPSGRHTLAFVVNHIGVPTRLLDLVAPFLACSARAGGRELPLHWKCIQLTGYTPQVRRVNPQFGFIEWCDTRSLPRDWQTTGFDDQLWDNPVPVARDFGPLRPLSSANVRLLAHELTPLAAGQLTETFGYERDDIPARFFLRDLAPAVLPPQGVWRRYDLGRVRLMRPRFALDLPAGTVVEFAYSEALVQGRVSPWITLSSGDSCNLDHYVARGGLQEFFPLTPRGGRFLEVHIFAPESQVKFFRETVVERAYYGAAGGSLQTGDTLLDQVWSVGVETHRACAEDAITDNPTRERGQWAGDVVTVGMDVAAVAFADLRLCRRSLVQCAQCAREDGIVAGLCPGGVGYLTTYAAQWITACLHYWELTGDRALLDEMWPYAVRNLAAFTAQTTADGVKDGLGWGFVDWGYVRNPGPSDMGVNLHTLTALRSMIRWAETLGHIADAEVYRTQATAIESLAARYFSGELATGGDAWTRIGYHRAALGLRLNFFDGTQAGEGRAFLQAHMLRCFPNRHDAPRLSDPAANSSQLITPYFGHFALPELIAHGDMDFVLGQYRTCWGWSLGGGRTTWLEVFDTRWSHCHQWAGRPTWQLSRYLLGLRPRFDRGAMHFDLALATGSLPNTSGTLPIPGRDEVITVAWTKGAAGLHYTLRTSIPLTIHLSEKLGGGAVAVEGDYTATWPIENCF